MALENVCCEDSHCRTTEEGNCSYLLPLSQCSSTRRFNVGHSTTVTKVKRRIYFQLTRDTQYLASMCRIWGFYGILTALLCILDIVDHVIIEFVSPMNIETRYDHGNFVFTDGTVGCHNDDLQCHPWGLCWHHDECRLTQFSNVCVCVCVCVFSGIRSYVWYQIIHTLTKWECDAFTISWLQIVSAKWKLYSDQTHILISNGLYLVLTVRSIRSYNWLQMASMLNTWSDICGISPWIRYM